MAARNSVSCCVDQPFMAWFASADGENYERLVVEPGNASRPRDLAVRVEARHRRGAGMARHAGDLVPNPDAEYALARDAVEREHADGLAAGQLIEGLHAGGVRGIEHRSCVALHQPRQPALWHLCDAHQGTLLEVRLRHETDVLLAAATSEAKRVRLGKLGERSGVPMRLPRCVQALQVDVERGPIVEQVDPIAG